MSLFAVTLAGEIRAARAVLRAAAPGSAAALAAALNHAEDCAADLERAERLLEQERASAERARAALDRALQLAEIEQQQQRRAEENLLDIEERERLAAAGINSEAEQQRLRKTLALASEAIREACTLRSAAQPGETIEATRQRWDDAHAIETAATAARKAARKALAALTVFSDCRSPEQIAEAIETTRTEALALKAAIDGRRERAQRGRVGRKKGGAL